MVAGGQVALVAHLLGLHEFIVLNPSPEARAVLETEGNTWTLNAADGFQVITRPTLVKAITPSNFVIVREDGWHYFEGDTIHAGSKVRVGLDKAARRGSKD